MEFLHEFGELHLVILICTAVVILYSDHKGFMYMLGKHEVLSERFVAFSHKLVWIGLIGMLLTGVALAIPSWEYLLSEGVFYVKMGFVFVLIINSFAIGSLSKVASRTPFAQLSREQKRTLIVSGALSATGWTGAAVIGLLFL